MRHLSAEPCHMDVNIHAYISVRAFPIQSGPWKKKKKKTIRTIFVIVLAGQKK